MNKLFGLIFLAVIGVVLAGCGNKANPTSTKVDTPPPPPVIGTEASASDSATP